MTEKPTLENHIRGYKNGYTRFVCYICQQLIHGQERMIPDATLTITCHVDCCAGVNIHKTPEQVCTACVHYYGSKLKRSGN
jgi:hypothetical protein